MTLRLRLKGPREALPEESTSFLPGVVHHSRFRLSGIWLTPAGQRPSPMYPSTKSFWDRCAYETQAIPRDAMLI